MESKINDERVWTKVDTRKSIEALSSDPDGHEEWGWPTNGLKPMHTPGPWKVNKYGGGWYAVLQGSFDISHNRAAKPGAIADSSHSAMGDQENLANASDCGSTRNAGSSDEAYGFQGFGLRAQCNF